MIGFLSLRLAVEPNEAAQKERKIEIVREIGE